MSNALLRIGISHGDFNGISNELILKTFEDNRIFELCIPILYGSSKVLAYHRKSMALPQVNTSTINHANDAGENRLNIISCESDEVNVDMAKQETPEARSFSQRSLDRSLEDLKEGLIDALLISPSTLNEADHLEKTIGRGKKGLKILVNDSFRIALATDKIPLKDIAGTLTVEHIAQQIKTLQQTLIRDFAITQPRIAVLSVNPGMGIKEGLFGEEEKIVEAAIEEAGKANVTCFGPYSADDFFGSGDYIKFDAVLAMYHDQGQIAFRTLAAEGRSFYIANLPYVFTAPEQTVSYEKAGQNVSDESSFRNAIYIALDVYRSRKTDREINANPLRKQFFERGSDNEKLDLTSE